MAASNARAAAPCSSLPSNWKRSTPALRNAPARAGEKSPGPATSTHRRSRWPNTRRAGPRPSRPAPPSKRSVGPPDRALDRRAHRRSEQGQVARPNVPACRASDRARAQHADSASDEPGAPRAPRPAGCDRSPAASESPSRRSDAPAWGSRRIRPSRTRRRTGGKPHRFPRRNRARRPLPHRPRHRKARRRYRRRRTPPLPPRTAPRARHSPR